MTRVKVRVGMDLFVNGPLYQLVDVLHVDIAHVYTANNCSYQHRYKSGNKRAVLSFYSFTFLQ